MDFPKRQTYSAAPTNVRSGMGSIYLILPHALCHLIQSLLSPSACLGVPRQLTVPGTRINIPRILFPFTCSFRGTGPSDAFAASTTLASDGYPPSQFTLFTANPCNLLSSLFPILIHRRCAEPLPLLSRPLPLPYSIPSAPHHGFTLIHLSSVPIPFPSCHAVPLADPSDSLHHLQKHFHPFPRAPPSIASTLAPPNLLFHNPHISPHPPHNTRTLPPSPPDTPSPIYSPFPSSFTPLFPSPPFAPSPSPSPSPSHPPPSSPILTHPLSPSPPPLPRLKVASPPHLALQTHTHLTRPRPVKTLPAPPVRGPCAANVTPPVSMVYHGCS